MSGRPRCWGSSAQQDKSHFPSGVLTACHTGCPSGVRSGQMHWVTRPGLTLLLAALPSRPCGASGPVRVRWLSRRAGADRWAGWGGSRASRGGGRGTSVWAGVPGVGPGPGEVGAGRGPAWLRPGAGLSQKTPVAVDG